MSAIVASRHSVAALIETLRVAGHIDLPAYDPDLPAKFERKHGEHVLPNPNFVHTDTCRHLVAGKMTVGASTSEAATSEQAMVSISFETMIFIWYVVSCYETTKDMDVVLDYLKLRDVVIPPHFDALEIFQLAKRTEDETMPIIVRDVCSLIMNAFFITRHPKVTVNEIYVHADSLLAIEFMRMQGEEAREANRYITRDGSQYIAMRYGTLVMEYVTAFMESYGNAWSVNQGRHV